MIRILEPRHDGFRNQETLFTDSRTLTTITEALGRSVTVLVIRQQETSLELPPVHDPLQPFTTLYILPDDERLDGDSTLLVAPIDVQEHIPPPPAVQSVHRPPTVAMKVPHRTSRADEVEDGGAGAAGGRGVLLGRRVSEQRQVLKRVRDQERVAVRFRKETAFDVCLERES